MRHFTFEQWAVSTTAKQKGIDNSVPINFRPRVQELIESILDPLVDAWGSNVIVTSGYRCEKLNKVIGGSNTSAHSICYAADLVPKNGKIEEFKQFTMKWLLNNNIQFDQYINENKPNSSWVHIGLKNGSGAQRKQYLLYKSWLPKGQQYTSINPNLYKGGEDIQQNVNNNSSNKQSNEENIQYGNAQSGSTQTGSTNGLLTGKSVYLNDINWEAIKNNDIFQKDENGEILVDANGDFIISDDYLLDGANENVSDEIEDINELPAEPIELNLDSINVNSIEQVKGISFNEDGSYAVKQSKSIQEIIAIFQQWWNAVQTLKNIDFKNIKESLKSQALQENKENQEITINAMVYMKAAFDMYGHAYREGMTCPVCGKRARYLPPGGYCSVECLLKDVKDKSLAFLMSPNEKYAWLYEIVDELIAVLDLSNLLINSIVLIPDIIRELAQLPDEYKQYIKNKITEGFIELQELLQRAIVLKNELLKKILKPISLGIIPKAVAMTIPVINTVNLALETSQNAFNIAFDAISVILDKLTAISEMAPGLKLPAESFAWSLTPRSFICPVYPTPINADMGKIFVVLPGGSGVPLQGIKPLLPSALQNINIDAIDTTMQKMFPPLIPADYYLEPELFKIRYLFSDQGDLVKQIRQQLEDLLAAGPDYIPKFENLLPVKTFTIAGKQVLLPNLGYVWFLLGLLDAWAPHSKAMVGSILNPLI